jgi:hypothetical protein
VLDLRSEATAAARTDLATKAVSTARDTRYVPATDRRKPSAEGGKEYSSRARNGVVTKRITVAASHLVLHDEAVRGAHGATASKPSSMITDARIDPSVADTETSGFSRPNFDDANAAPAHSTLVAAHAPKISPAGIAIGGS